MRYNYKFSPTRESVSEALGVRAPVAWVKALEHAFLAVDGREEAFLDYFEPLLGFRLGTDDLRLPQTPPEFFPVGATRTGTFFGFVVHAPEVPADDYPLAEFTPAESDKVTLAGRNTREALENLAAWQLALDELNEGQLLDNADRLRRLAEALAIDPTPEKARRRFDPEGGALPVEPETPPGYLHFAGEDGVGVLAPRSAFRRGGRPKYRVSGALEWFLEAGLTALAEKAPATALLLLKEGYALHFGAEDTILLLTGPMAEAYRQLGRSTLARVVERRLSADLP